MKSSTSIENPDSLHTLSKFKLKPLLPSLWSKLEELLVSLNVEYFLDNSLKEKKIKKIKKHGFLLVTFGAIYIFKKNLLTESALKYRVSYLDIKKVEVYEGKYFSLFFENEDYLRVYSKKSQQICEVLSKIIQECTFGVQNLILPSFISLNQPKMDSTENKTQNVKVSFNNNSDNNDTPCNDGIVYGEKVIKRPENALIKRSIFLAHFYDKKGMILDFAKYFEKFESKLGNTLSIGPHFHPGNFSLAYGHAIGWEASIDKVAFMRFKSSKFSSLFESLLINAQTIKQISFTDYSQNDQNIPEIKLYKVDETNVKSFWFHRSFFPIIESFLKGCIDYQCLIDEFIISSCTLKASDLAKMFKCMAQIECFMELKTVAIYKNNVKPFPLQQCGVFLESASYLETLLISDTVVDASQILTAVCQSKSPLKVLKLTNLKFNSAINCDNLDIPSNLVYVDFSRSMFQGSTLKDILTLFTKNSPISQPIMLRMSNIGINDISLTETFKYLNKHLSSLKPNICEFDWSSNILPDDAINYFFNFLHTQTKLRILILNAISLNKQGDFFKQLEKLIFTIQLPGLDMRSKLYKKFAIPFFEELKKATFLRRLCVIVHNGGDECLEKLMELIKFLPMLTEFAADGFKPKNLDLLLKVWNEVAKSTTIKANDCPLRELKNLNIQINDLDNKSREMMKIIMSRPRPSNPQQRADFIIEQLHAQFDSLSTTEGQTTDVFYGTCSTPWIDATPDSRLADLEKTNVSDDENDGIFIDDENEKANNSILVNQYIHHEKIRPTRMSDLNNDEDEDPKKKEMSPSKRERLNSLHEEIFNHSDEIIDTSDKNDENIHVNDLKNQNEYIDNFGYDNSQKFPEEEDFPSQK